MVSWNLIEGNMNNYFRNKKCELCRKKIATQYRCISGRLYYICDSEKCNNISLSRAGLLKLLELPKDITR